MKSTIKIEFDFDTKEPYINAVIKPSDDLRDQMLQAFFEKLNGGNLLKVDFGRLTMVDGSGDYRTIKLTPLKNPHAVTDEPNFTFFTDVTKMPSVASEL